MLVYVERHGTRSYLTRDGAKFMTDIPGLYIWSNVLYDCLLLLPSSRLGMKGIRDFYNYCNTWFKYNKGKPLGLNKRGTIVAGVLRPPSGKAVSLSPRLSVTKTWQGDENLFFINWVVRDCNFKRKKPDRSKTINISCTARAWTGLSKSIRFQCSKSGQLKSICCSRFTVH